MTIRSAFRSLPLWLIVVGLSLTCVTAVAVGAPAAALVLAGLCAVLALLRAVTPGRSSLFAVRSRPLDVTGLLLLAVALVLLAPAGLLT